MRIDEVAPPKINLDKTVKEFKDFFKICMEVLELDRLPKIHWISDTSHTKAHHSFGSFHIDDQSIHIEINNRHPVDIMRTLAHELVHYKQWTEGRIKPDSGKTGSPEENEAHIKAGIIMRYFDNQNPEAFQFKTINENLSINELANTPYRYMLWKRTMNGNSYLFQTDSGQEIVTSIVPEILSDGTHRIEVMFADKKDFGLEKTGKGDAFRIFATVAQILKDYIKDAKFEIGEIFFSGKTKEPSRIKLYDKIARRLGDHIPGYKFTGSGEDGVDKGYYFKKTSVDENFADGEGPGRPGDSARHGIPKGATIAQLEKAAKAKGRKGQLARWQLNMRRGKKK